MVNAQRKVLLEQMMEKGRRESAVVLPFPKKKSKERKILGSDSIFYVSYGIIALGMFSLIVTAGNSSDHIVVQAEPEPTPHDIWSFLSSRSGRAVINGTFKTIQVFASK